MIFALAITGPTASGKTAISIELSKRLGCEIISCDSMQIYRGMDIGTAKATADERAAVPHHLIDFLSPSEGYSVERYRAEALSCVKDISSRGKIPLFVGGTGLYIDSVMRPSANDSPIGSPEKRVELARQAEEPGGVDRLYERLCAVDPESAALTHKNNLKRVIRALEIFELTGKPKSYFDKLSREARSDISVGMITLDFHDRENLYRRVDERVDIMINDGLVEETRRLLRYYPHLSSTASQAIGYKELMPYLDGRETLDEAVEKIKLSSRRYAKRQLTWFRHEQDAKKLFVDGEDGKIKDKEQIINEALELAKDFLNSNKSE